MITILTGAAMVGYTFRDGAEATSKAVPVLVHHYATAAGVDVHPAETSLVECSAGDRRWTEVRLGSTIIGSWREGV